MFLSCQNSDIVIVRWEIRKIWQKVGRAGLRWINISFRGSKEEKIFFCKLPSSYSLEFLDTRFENDLHLYIVLVPTKSTNRQQSY